MEPPLLLELPPHTSLWVAQEKAKWLFAFNLTYFTGILFFLNSKESQIVLSDTLGHLSPSELHFLPGYPTALLDILSLPSNFLLTSENLHDQNENLMVYWKH